MSVSPRDLLREAMEIAQRQAEESARRSAISRAYYAAFHGAKLFHAQLLRPGSSKPNVGEHENLIHQLRYPDTRMDSSVQGQSKVAGGMLLRLRPMRIRADYRLTEAIGIGDMSDAIELAAQLLDICDPKT